MIRTSTTSYRSILCLALLAAGAVYAQDTRAKVQGVIKDSTQAIIVGSRRGPGITAVFGIANQGVEANRLDSLLAAQVDSVRTTSVSPEELIKAKNTFRAQFIENRETTLARAEELHHYDMFHHSVEDINTDLDRYLAVTADDLRRVAQKYLDPANTFVIVVKPGTAPAAGGAQ